MKVVTSYLGCSTRNTVKAIGPFIGRASVSVSPNHLTEYDIVLRHGDGLLVVNVGKVIRISSSLWRSK